MDPAADAALPAFLLALADDELILGHRNSEWCGHAPILEEDIAFANLAQDEIGHAQLWFRLVESLTGRPPDHYAYHRPPADYRCAQLVELPKGDWAFSMLRQYLFDTAEAIRLPVLARSPHTPLAETAAKIRTEEIYHLRHTQAWIRRLGLGTDESHRRTQAALDTLWPLTPQLFQPAPEFAAWPTAVNAIPGWPDLEAAWHDTVVPFLTSAGLNPTARQPPLPLDRRVHTEFLPTLLDELQSVANLEPEGVQW